MTTLLAIAMIGAFLNRVRGGLFDSFLQPLDGVGKVVNDLAFTILFSLLTDWHTGVWYGIAMLTGRSFGWGEYIGAIINGSINTGNEVPYIDRLIKRFTKQPLLWGVLGLTLRGALWGICLGMVQHSIIPVLAGATMGCVYFLTVAYARARDKWMANRGWGYGEYVFGGILWAATAYNLV